MKKMYEGASAISVVFFLIIVVGGFLFGTKTHIEKSNNKRKTENKVSKSERKRDERHKKNAESMEKIYQERDKEREEELDYLRKMNDPLWHYYDEESDSFVTVPGRYNADVPHVPRVQHVY